MARLTDFHRQHSPPLTCGSYVWGLLQPSISPCLPGWAPPTAMGVAAGTASTPPRRPRPPPLSASSISVFSLLLHPASFPSAPTSKRHAAASPSPVTTLPPTSECTRSRYRAARTRHTAVEAAVGTNLVRAPAVAGDHLSAFDAPPWRRTRAARRVGDDVEAIPTAAPMTAGSAPPGRQGEKGG
jgi:hypothetical protein